MNVSERKYNPGPREILGTEPRPDSQKVQGLAADSPLTQPHWPVYTERALTSTYSFQCKHPVDTLASKLTHGAQGRSRSWCNSLILHLVNVWHWAHYLSFWVFSYKIEVLLPLPALSVKMKWECLIHSEPWVNYSSMHHFLSLALCRCCSTHLKCLLFSYQTIYSLPPFKILLKFHFLKKPSLSPEHSRNNMDKAPRPASTWLFDKQ